MGGGGRYVCMLWKRRILTSLWVRIGCTLADRRRGLAVYQGERDDAHASAHIFFRRWKRAAGRAHEVPVGSLPSLLCFIAIWFSPRADRNSNFFLRSRYKGMASTSSGSSAPRTPTRVTPQQTGFSQMGGRPGAANESAGAGMSVLLSWHEKVVDVAGLGCIGRVMTDWRRV